MTRLIWSNDEPSDPQPTTEELRPGDTIIRPTPSAQASGPPTSAFPINMVGQ